MATDKLNILIVDDESPHRMMIKRALKSIPDISTIEADSVSKATAIVNRDLDKLSLAVVDLNLGGHSGLEVVTLLRSFRALTELPILVISTSTLDSDIESGYISGANCYLYKTTSPEQFTADIVCAVKFFLQTSTYK